jgi:hypothetical protein
MYEDKRGFVDTQDNQKAFNEKFIDETGGPFIGQVKYTEDPLKMGRLGVNIPALSNTENPTSEQVVWCRYLSPFYGAKSINSVDPNDPLSYSKSQASYGMWAIPPDIDTSVLVIFAKGEPNKNLAFWIGCIQDPVTNHMVPGLASNINTGEGMDTAGEFPSPGQSSDPEINKYGAKFLPAGEKNRGIIRSGETLSALNKWQLPLNVKLADQLHMAGLVQDPVRGTTSSSARRESPSNVFGWSTPGPVLADSRSLNIGIDNAPVTPDRGIGHSFVMDDGDVLGNNQLTRLRTSSGHQLLMHDSEGVVYLANGSGKAWIEMDRDGKINVYSNQGISFRTEGDFNIHADNNIQLHAKNKVSITAETDINLNAEEFVHTMGQSGILSASQGGAIRHYGAFGISSYTPMKQLHGAGQRIDLSSAGQVHFNSVPPRSIWGPGWLNPNHVRVGITATGAVDVITKDQNGNTIAPTDGTRIRTNEASGGTKTTVSEFPTHEPYKRVTRDSLLRDLKNKAIEDLIKQNLNLQSAPLKALLAKNPNIDAAELSSILSQNSSMVNTELNKVLSKIRLPGDPDEILKAINLLTGLDQKLKLNITSLKNLTTNADNIKTAIKNKLTNIIASKIKDAVAQGVSQLKKYF